MSDLFDQIIEAINPLYFIVLYNRYISISVIYKWGHDDDLSVNNIQIHQVSHKACFGLYYDGFCIYAYRSIKSTTLINVWFKNGILIVCAPIYMNKHGLSIVMQNKEHT